ncbi:hypothetical protein FS749_008707 [Ceratobasidium sp. UAMH 11750]|nr:hypothetical protein FS749_008707 [Ceratobasidium sp. UAMH 11750]
MFGAGGYDKFIADFIDDVKDEHEMEVGGAERNNGGSGSVPPKAARGLVLSSRGGAASISPSTFGQLGGLSGPSSLKGAGPSTGGPGVPSLPQEQDNVTTARAADEPEPTTPLDFCSPKSQISQSSAILSTVHASTSSSSLPPSSPSPSSCSGISESFVDEMIEQI